MQREKEAQPFAQQWGSESRPAVDSVNPLYKMMRYWIYLDGEIPGQFEVEELVQLPGFTEKALVCPADGDLSARRWQPAGTVADIAQILSSMPPPLPETQHFSQAIGPQDLLDQTNLRLFRHISQLMKEIEEHRASRPLIQSLQKKLLESQEELQTTRNKVNELEKNYRELQDNLAKAGREKNEAFSKRIEDLTRALADKDLALNKSIGALSRAEQELGKMIAPTVTPPVNETELLKIPELAAPRTDIPAKPDAAPPPLIAAPLLVSPPPPPNGLPSWKQAFNRGFALLSKFLTPPGQ